VKKGGFAIAACELLLMIGPPFCIMLFSMFKKPVYMH